METSSSCFIFEKVSDALVFSLQDFFGIKIVVSVFDYFIFVEDFFQKYQNALNSFLHLFTFLGIPIAENKTMGPIKALSFLDLQIDASLMLARLPVNKLSKYYDEQKYTFIKIYDSVATQISRRKTSICHESFQGEEVVSYDVYTMRL